MTNQTLRVELCFRPNPFAARWLQVLPVVWAWEPRVKPSRLERLSDAEFSGRPEPWTEAFAEELARRCASEPPLAWMLFGEEGALRVAHEGSYVKLSVILTPPPVELASWFLRLIELFPEEQRPALAMLFDPESKQDGELIMQGLDQLFDVPPLFYIDGQAATQLGGLERMKNAPVDVREAPGGLMFLVRPPIGRALPQDREQAKAMRSYLGLSSRTPLSLLEDEHQDTPVGEQRWNLVQWWATGTEGYLAAGWSAAVDNAWAVGEAGTIVHWDGNDWSAADEVSTKILSAIWGADERNVFTVGEAGEVLRWDGKSWSRSDNPVGAWLYGVWGNGSGQVFAVGAEGTLLRWDGLAWSALPSVTSRALFAISGVGSAAWAVGEAGTLLRWDGVEWSSAESPTDAALHGVYALSPDEAWAVGVGGCVLRLQGGVWSQVESGTSFNLSAVFARANDDVWVAGDNCTLRHWNGLRWNQIESDTHEALMGLCEAGDEGVWAFGSEAIILLVTPI